MFKICIKIASSSMSTYFWVFCLLRGKHFFKNLYLCELQELQVPYRKVFFKLKLSFTSIQTQNSSLTSTRLKLIFMGSSNRQAGSDNRLVSYVMWGTMASAISKFANKFCKYFFLRWCNKYICIRIPPIFCKCCQCVNHSCCFLSHG